jgi:uncharacterized 2Fe-2S/4Fe-4S cluster protein (DUF4445 family)
MSTIQTNAMIQVTLEPMGSRVQVTPGFTLLDCAQKAGVDIMAVCGGNGTCGMCKVILMQGQVSPLDPAESVLLDPIEIKKGLRLACQTRVFSDARVQFPPESLATLQRLQLEGQETTIRPHPAVRWVDGERRVVLNRMQIVSILPADSALYGYAVDIGTTKIAGYLLDLQTGHSLAAAGVTNPQIAFGEDVISRIEYSDSHPQGGRELQRLLVDALNELLGGLCRQTGVNLEQVVDSVMVGNTAMHHLLVGCSVHSLGTAPYEAAILQAMRLPAAEIGLRMAPGAMVYLPPNIAGFVGGDHVAMLLASRAAKFKQTVIALDIGTNTEISLIHHGRHFACSCASGPAFEGAHIHEGIRAIPGAIERVRLEGDAVQVHTIGGKPAIGICGSGILDAVAELRRVDILDGRGAFRKGNDRLHLQHGKPAFLLVPASKSGHGRDISVNREDVNEIQLAKAAIRSGVEVLLREAGITYNEIEVFLVAGAFGSYLDLRNAIHIGMFPPIPLERYRQVGNAAGAGARQMLISTRMRSTAEHLGDKIEYVELTTVPGYTDIFMDAIRLD